MGPRVFRVTSDSIHGFFRLNCTERVCIMYLGSSMAYPMLAPGRSVDVVFRVGDENVMVQGTVREKRYSNHPLTYYYVVVKKEPWMEDKKEYEVIITW